MTAAHRRLRDAFGCYATGIAIVTCAAPGGEAVAITVNSFTSVSLEPPLVLWCLDNGSHRYAQFAAADNYAVNVLRADQEAVSRAFASTETAPDPASVTTWVTGAPVLLDCLARFDCRVVEKTKAGDHLLLIGEVLKFDAAAGEPLIYYRSAYRSGVGG